LSLQVNLGILNGYRRITDENNWAW
jgi:hypothetical protein